jgi:hypothetical protein
MTSSEHRLALLEESVKKSDRQLLVPSLNPLGDSGGEDDQQPFRLMDLAVEIRLYIFEQVLGGSTIFPEAVPGPRFRSHITMGKEANYAIFLVSKQVRAEALRAGWEGTRKCFMCPWDCEEVMEIASWRPPPYNWIAKMELNLATSDWFVFFGIRISPDERHLEHENSEVCPLQSIPTLRDLQLTFRSPYDSGNSSPWYENAVRSDILQYFIAPLPGTDRTTLADKVSQPCYRIIPDWVLTFAFPYIKHIPKIRLAGCIKTDVRKRWEQVLAEEYHRKEGERDHRTDKFNWEEAVARIKSLDVSVPPLCTCPMPCTSNPGRFTVDTEGECGNSGSITERKIVFEAMADFDVDDEYTLQLRKRGEKLKRRMIRRGVEKVHFRIVGPYSDLPRLEEKYPETAADIRAEAKLVALLTEIEEKMMQKSREEEDEDGKTDGGLGDWWGGRHGRMGE